MENKYQHIIETIREYYPKWFKNDNESKACFEEDLDTLQELVDNYSILEKALNEASNIISKDSSRDERSFHCILAEDARDYFLQKAKEELESEEQ